MEEPILFSMNFDDYPVEGCDMDHRFFLIVYSWPDFLFQYV